MKSFLVTFIDFQQFFTGHTGDNEEDDSGKSFNIFATTKRLEHFSIEIDGLKDFLNIERDRISLTFIRGHLPHGRNYMDLTRFGDFRKFLVTNSLSKVAQIFRDILGHLKMDYFFVSGLVALLNN